MKQKLKYNEMIFNKLCFRIDGTEKLFLTEYIRSDGDWQDLVCPRRIEGKFYSDVIVRKTAYPSVGMVVFK